MRDLFIMVSLIPLIPPPVTIGVYRSAVNSVVETDISALAFTEIVGSFSIDDIITIDGAVSMLVLLDIVGVFIIDDITISAGAIVMLRLTFTVGDSIIVLIVTMLGDAVTFTLVTPVTLGA